MLARTRRLLPLLGIFGALAGAAACADSASTPTGVDAGARALTAPAPTPAPAPAPTTTTCPVSSDSVVAGYGSCSTGGIEYQNFEYEPETGTEYVVTPDTACAEKGMTSTSSDPERCR